MERVRSHLASLVVVAVLALAVAARHTGYWGACALAAAAVFSAARAVAADAHGRGHEE